MDVDLPYLATNLEFRAPRLRVLEVRRLLVGRYSQDGRREDEEGRYRVRGRVRQQQDHDEALGRVREGEEAETGWAVERAQQLWQLQG